MGFFEKKEKQSGGEKKPADLREIARFGGILSDMVITGLTNDKGKVLPEDAITLMATIAGERCIDAAGDVPLRDHELIPGSRVFSDKMNSFLFGGSGDGTWDSLPPVSAFGFLYRQLLTQKFKRPDFPDLREVLKHFAETAEDPQYRGTAPLTVPKEFFPHLSPLKIGFESRRDVDERLRPLPSREDKVTAALWALMEVLIFARQGMPPPVCLRLAVEMLHGMAKTASMTQRRMDEMGRK